MAKGATTTALGGRFKMTEDFAPDREKGPGMGDKGMPTFGGGPNDLSSTLDGNKPPSGKKAGSDS